MFKRLKLSVIVPLIVLVSVRNSFSQVQVVPCQLNNPDQDTLRLFPERTNYRTEFIRTDEIGEKRGIGGEALYRELEKRLDDKWDPIWETKDIPYVFYEILKGPDRIGWVFGANQGWPGADNSQLMFAFDLDGRIQEFYYQKLPSLEKNTLQTQQFYSQFIGLTLEQFYVHEYLESLTIKDKDILALNMIARIRDPTQKEHEGFRKTLRGIKKVLIYLDDFKFGNKIKKEDVFEKAKYLIENKNKIPLLGQDALSEIKKNFPDVSRYVVDFVSLKNNSSIIEERLGEKLNISTEPVDLVYPIYVVYKDDLYRAPFVRGNVLGYVIPVSIDIPEGKFIAIISIGAVDKQKGKIISFEINKSQFPQFQGLSLVHFYTKEILLKLNKTDEKLDKITPLMNIVVDGKEISHSAQRTAKKALIIIDEFYFHNFFKKDEIMNKIEDYLKKTEK